jgi:hypothetical protein
MDVGDSTGMPPVFIVLFMITGSFSALPINAAATYNEWLKVDGYIVLGWWNTAIDLSTCDIQSMVGRKSLFINFFTPSIPNQHAL